MPPTGKYLLLPIRSSEAAKQIARDIEEALGIEIDEGGQIVPPVVRVPDDGGAQFAAFKMSERNPFHFPITGRIGDYRGTPYSVGHTGVDFAHPCGTVLVALRDGEVIREGLATDGLTGIFVTVRYDDGIIATWAHMSRSAVSRGQRVSAMDWIGNSGNTGSAGIGCHLHLELHTRDFTLGTMQDIVDPLAYFTELQ